VVAAAAQAAARNGRYCRVYPVIVLDMPCTLYSLRTKQLPTASIIARNLQFNPVLQQYADRIVKAMWLEVAGPARGLGKGSIFNGVHLRLEADSQEWLTQLGGEDKLLQAYLQVKRWHAWCVSWQFLPASQ
jgi:hypothetical protein